MVRMGREVRSQKDYILGINRRLFSNVSVWDLRHNLDRYIILGCLHRATLIEHTKYLGWQTQLPLRPPTTLTT